MNLELDQETFNWLIALTVLRRSPAYKINNSGKVVLDQKTTEKFEQGHHIISVLAALDKAQRKV